MNIKKYSSILVLCISILMSCKDDSLLPLPYNDRTTGAYLRIYKQTSNVFDLNDLTNSAFEAVFEPVDENNGDDLERVDFFVSHRRGTNLTQEVFVKSVSSDIFIPVIEPTYSDYKRGAIRITSDEALTALRAITADPDGDGITAPICQACIPLKGLSAFGAAGTFAAGDQIIVRYEMVMKDGRKISASNPQSSVNPAFANTATTNSTANITTGQFYNSPFVVIMTVRAVQAGSWVGTYQLDQRAIWSPNHSVGLHGTSYPAYMNEILFPAQTVTLSVPSSGLSTERIFTVNYRGQNVSMRINLEQTAPGLTGATGTAALTTLSSFGFVGATNTNLGTVFVPLINSTVDCSSERELYWVTPTTGVFEGTSALPIGLPRSTFPARGVYRTDISGTNPGDTFSISVDDDCDEYGRRNGYCTWTRRVYLSLTKI